MTGQLQEKRIWIAGHRGMLGQALMRRLARENAILLTPDRNELDLFRQAQVERWMEHNRPQLVFVAAAKVGGIQDNINRPAAFLYENLAIELNIIHAAWQTQVEKLLFFGSSCIYPRHTAQPMTEDSLLTGVPEPTNEGYALAKIAGVKMCEYYRRQYGCDFISTIPTNLYGPNDNFDPLTSHVIPGMIVRTHRAKMEHQPTLDIWGTGTARREFMHVDEAADASVFLMQNYSDPRPINVGVGHDISIAELATLIADVVDYTGKLVFDPTKPDGMPVKRLDVGRLKTLGWQSRVPLRQGLVEAYEWYQSQQYVDGA